MGDAALAEERALPVEGAVDELIDQHEGAGRQFLLVRAAGGERDEVGHAGALEHVDIGAVVDVGGREPVPLVVARQEDHRRARDLAHAQRRRRLAPRAFDRPPPHLLEPRQIVDAGAADDAEYGSGHVRSRRRGCKRIATAQSADALAGPLRGAGVGPTKGSLTRADIRSAEVA